MMLSLQELTFSACPSGLSDTSGAAVVALCAVGAVRGRCVASAIGEGSTWTPGLVNACTLHYKHGPVVLVMRYWTPRDRQT